jgi:hypothetical protein
MKYAVLLAMLGFAGLSVFLLYHSQPEKQESMTQAPMTAAPMTGDHQHPGMGGAVYSGKVVETMDAGGYTYIHVDSGHDKVWAAGPLTEVAVGEQVSFLMGMEMNDFTSDALKRTFDSIYFVPSIDHGAGEMPPPSPHARVAVPVHEMNYSGIEVPDGGMRIASVYGSKKDLAGRKVVVRGKVVKFTPGVMKKNWIHLRDGSGAEGTNDLAVTTDAMVEVGDVVVVEGKLGVDKDFGFGYSYPVIVEDATVAVDH